MNIAQILFLFTIATSKIGTDVALYAVAGSAQYISLAGVGWSAMPHKNNLVKAEIRTVPTDHAASLTTSVLRAARHKGHRSGHAWALKWLVLPQLCLVTGQSMNLVLCLIDDIETLGVRFQPQNSFPKRLL